MARRPSPTRAAKLPKGSKRSSSPRRRSRRGKGAIGAIAGGLLGILGGLFGGRGGSIGPNRLDAAPITGGRAKGTGKANYGPLPSFTTQSKTVRRYGNPTLATISLQMSDSLKELGLIKNSLSNQFRLQQFAYNENARVQREINAESRGEGFVPFTPASGDGARLGSLSIKQLNDSFMQFSKALDDATDALNNMDCSCDGSDIDLPGFIPIPTDDDDDKKKKKRKTDKNIKPFQRVAKSVALTKEGNLKPGYVAKKDSLGRTYYIKQSGMEGAIRRRAPSLGRFFFGRQSFDFTSSEIKRLTSKGYTQSGIWWRGPDGKPATKEEIVKAAKSPVSRMLSNLGERASTTLSNISETVSQKITGSRPVQAAKAVMGNIADTVSKITKPFADKISSGYQVATRLGKAAVTKIKSFASTISGLAKWAWAGVDEVFSKLKGKYLDFFNRFIAKSPKFGQVCDTLKKAAGSAWAKKLFWFVFWLYALYEYGLRYYTLYKNRKSLSHQQISDELTAITTDMVSQLGVATLAFMVGGVIGGMLTGPGGVITAIVGGIIGLVIDWVATVAGAKDWTADLIRPYLKQLFDFFVGTDGKKVGGENANLSATQPPKKQPTPMSQSGSEGKGTVPFKKPAAAAAAAPKLGDALKNAPKETVGDLMNATASRVGIDPSLMNMIASENNAFNPKKQVQSVNGSEIFKLTPQQWSYITSQYGPKYPELYAGINDPKAATTAGALLIKDSQEFLTKNNIPASPLSIYGSYLFGYEGIRKLLNSQPSDIASSVLPEAAQARPELFKDTSGDITTGTLVQKLYDRTLPEKQKQAPPQGVPAVPPATTPKVDGLKTPTPTPTPTPSPAPAAPAAPSGSPAAPSAEDNQKDKTPAASSAGSTYSGPTHTATPSAPEAGKEPAAEMVPSTPVNQTAQPVPPAPSTSTSAMVDEKTKELEQAAKDAQAIADNPIVIAAMGGKNAPAVLPSSRPGYTGTGNVPDPYYMFMDQYEYQFRFKSSPVLATAQTSWT